MSRILEFCDFREHELVGDIDDTVHAPDPGGIFYTGTAGSFASAPVDGPIAQAVVAPSNLSCKRPDFGGPSAGVRVLWKTSTLGTDQLVVELFGTGGTTVQLRVNTSNQLYLTGAVTGSPLTSTTTVLSNTYYETEVAVHLSDTSGRWRVFHRAQGTTGGAEIAALTGSGGDNQSIGGAELYGMRFDNANQTFAQVVLWASDSEFTLADCYAREGQLLGVAYPSAGGDGFYQDFDNVNNPGSQLAPEIDEIRSDGNTSTIVATANGDKSTFTTNNLNAVTLGITKMLALRVLIQHATVDGFKHHRPLLRIAGSNYFGVDGGFGFEWTKTVDIWLEDPSTTTPWASMTGSDAVDVVNAMEIGLEHDGSTAWTKVSHVSPTVLFLTILDVSILPDPVVAPGVVPAPSTALAVLPSPVVAIGSSPIPAFIGAPPAMVPDPVVAVGVVPVPTITLGQAPPPQPPTVRRDTQPAYLGMLLDLLPRGFAWTREPEAVLTRFLDSVAAELAALESRVEDLLRESDPRTTLELLADWERNFGLPDPCVGPLDALAARRAALVARLASPGGGSPAFFEEYLASIGYPDARVVEFHPFTAGHARAGDRLTSPQRPFRAGFARAGDRLTNSEKWLHTWAVEAPFVTKQRFTAGHSTAGEPLATWGNDQLECAIEAIAPAQTFVLFLYFHLLRPDPVVATVVLPPVSLT